MQNINVGDMVRFTGKWYYTDQQWWYPKLGSIGRVINVSDGAVYVRWNAGSTSGNDCFWTFFENVERV